MAQRRALGLRRDVALPAVAGTIFGNVAVALFLALGVTAREALGLTPVVFIVAGIVFLLTLLAYVEGIAMLPQAGGSSGFARAAFNDLISFIAAWALILDYLIVVAASAFFASHYLASLPGLEMLSHSPIDLLTSIALIVAVGLVNAQEIELGARLSVLLALLGLVAQVGLAVLGMFIFFDSGLIAQTVELGVAPTWGQLAFALPVAMIGFTGLDVVANLSGELRNPGVQLPRPMAWSAATAVVLLVVMSIVGLSALPVHGEGGRAATDLGTTWVDRPLIGIVDAAPLGNAAEAMLHGLVGITAALVLFLAANTSMSGLARLVYAMSLNRQVPSALARIDRSEGAPVLVVVLFTAAAAGLLVVTWSIQSSALVLAQLYAFGAMLSFMIATASLIRMRFTQPDLERPFRAPWNVAVRGHSVSIVLVLSLLMTTSMWMLVLITHDAARALGIIWLTFGFIAYAVYRLTHGLSLVECAAPHLEMPLEISARPYTKVLVAVRPERGRLWGAGDAEVAALAQKLLEDGGGAGGELAVMMVHELPLTKELNAPLGSIEEVTAERLGLLRRVTRKLGVRMTSTVARSRAAGRAICQEAARRGVDAVVLATRRKRRVDDVVFGRTVSYVLRHAPCDVIVMSFPDGALKRAESSSPKKATSSPRQE